MPLSPADTVHNAFDHAIKRHGVDVDAAEKKMQVILDDFVADLGPKHQLLVLAAGEHLIYEISSCLLGDDRVLQGMNPEARRLFKWHALEEIKHKSVGFDLCVHLYGMSLADKL